MASCRLLVVGRSSIWQGVFLWHVDLILPVHGLNFKGGRALGSKERSGCQDNDEPEGEDTEIGNRGTLALFFNA